MSERWLIHIVGTDDVIEQADELKALREANEINKAELMLKRLENAPFVIAIVKDSNEKYRFTYVLEGYSFKTNLGSN